MLKSGLIDRNGIELNEGFKIKIYYKCSKYSNEPNKKWSIDWDVFYDIKTASWRLKNNICNYEPSLWSEIVQEVEIRQLCTDDGRKISTHMNASEVIENTK